MNQEVVVSLTTGQKFVISISIEAIAKEYENLGDKPKLDDILEKVSSMSQISIEDIAGKSRQFKFLLPRYAFCHIGHKVYGYSQKQVGRMVNRDHTTVINACEEFKNMREQNIPDVLILMKALQTKFPVVI